VNCWPFDLQVTKKTRRSERSPGRRTSHESSPSDSKIERTRFTLTAPISGRFCGRSGRVDHVLQLLFAELISYFHEAVTEFTDVCFNSLALFFGYAVVDGAGDFFLLGQEGLARGFEGIELFLHFRGNLCGSSASGCCHSARMIRRRGQRNH